jgi:hypothetical protein
MDPLPAQPSADPATADMPTATEVREVVVTAGVGQSLGKANIAGTEQGID